MTSEEYARQIVAGWPPLTVRQREAIQNLLRPDADQEQARVRGGSLARKRAAA